MFFTRGQTPVGSVDLVAPGSAFTIADGGSSLVATGTSNAAPIAAGAVALLFSLISI